MTLARGGRIRLLEARAPIGIEGAQLDDGPLRGAVADVDAKLAEIDRLLARVSAEGEVRV